MKKLFVLLALISVFSLVLLGCNIGKNIDDVLETEIIEDYLIWSGIQSDKTVDEIDHEYFGTYGDSVAIYFHTAGAYETPVEEEIAGYTFNYPDSRVIRIWNNGKFYKMPEAYELGFINYFDVLMIKTKSLFLEFQEPNFIYEKKTYRENLSLNDEFAGNCILVLLDKGISDVNKVHSKEFFAGVEIESVVDNSYTERPVTEKERENWQQIIVLYLPQDSKEKVIEGIKALEKIDGIVFACENAYIRPELTPNDTYYSSPNPINGQWALSNIEVEKVWDFTYGTDEIRVGVIDTGISIHSDLDSNYDASNDAFDFYNILSGNPISKAMDTHSHGTHIAGIIGANGNNMQGITGVNWELSLVQLRAAEAPILELLSVLNAIKWASDNYEASSGVRIISFSLGWYTDYPLFETRIREYTNKGGLFICSTGNKEQNNDLDGQYHYPSFYASNLNDNPIENMITVNRTNYSNSRPYQANWGANTIMIYAPGQDILSTVSEDICINNSDIVSTAWGDMKACECEYTLYDGAYQYIPISRHMSNGYHYMTGSSMSTPHVTGVAALLLSVNPDLTAAELKECILEGADIITITTGDGATQQVKKLNAWGAFVYLMKNYPSFAQTIGFNDVTYTYNIDADAEYMKDHTAMMKLDITEAGQYTFTVSANDSIDVKFYDNSITETSTTQIKTNNNGTVEFTLTLSEGTYYLRTNYVDSASEGIITVAVDCPPHTHDMYLSMSVGTNQHGYKCRDCGYIDEDTIEEHSFDGWVFVSDTLHRSECECGARGSTTAGHVFRMPDSPSDPRICMGCGYTKFLGGNGGNIIISISKVTVNGSYQMPDGTIYLVDSDIEAYFGGTLVFYDKDDLPVVQ